MRWATSGLVGALGLLAGMAWSGAAGAQAGLDPGTARFRDFALSSTSESLDNPDLAINREMTGSTAETMVELLTTDRADGSARIRLKSVDAEVSVPLGWHAFEDHERAAVFTPDRSVRIIFWRVDLQFEGVTDLEQYVATKRGAMRSRFPALEHEARKLPDGQYLAVYRGVPGRRGDREARTVIDLLTPNPRNPQRAFLITFGTPTSQADRYLPLLALIARERKVAWTVER